MVEIVEEVTENMARICHEANRAFCTTIGDDSQPAWTDAPDWQKKSAKLGVLFHMSGEHGPEASHNSWMKEKVDGGWVYGEVKDPEKKTHPCIRPFNELPPEQQMKDILFRSIVHAFKAEILK